jgi:crotonobetainyl-CoA:carnitine CoA-transferase CaiB-like acyl-CoA transferase
MWRPRPAASEDAPLSRTAPPTLGQHSRQVLGETLGLSIEAIAALVEQGVVQ